MTDAMCCDTVRELVGAQCVGDADAVALFAPYRRPLTYHGLAEQVDSVGQALRAAGIESGDRVGVVLPNGPDMAAAIMGVASFSACAPLNPQLRAEELKVYLTSVRARGVVVPHDIDSPAREAARHLGLTILELASSTRAAGRFLLRHEATNDNTDAAPNRAEDIALILHTSGTTSRPKLVPLTHGNLVESANNIRRALELTAADCCLGLMPLFHIHGLVGVLLASVAAGASVVCAPEYQAAKFFDWMSEFRPTWYSAVPTIHQSVLDRVRNGASGADTSRLRLIRSSSSALPPRVMRDLEETFRVPVIEAYGMTEAAHQIASNPLPPQTRKSGSVGIPAGPEVGIMNDDDVLLERKQTGEIVIRGPNVTQGYERNTEANAAAFANGWFRTGDQGFCDEDGYLYITGRTKEMINRGGESIAPREIDEALLEHSAVAQAAAFAVPHPRLGEDIAAAVVLRDESGSDERELRAFVQTRLADFKVPNQIVIVAEIPKGPTGKIQRSELSNQLASLLKPTYAAPRNSTQQMLVALWEEVLQREQVGIHDNFFSIGGDSIQATMLVSRLRADYETEIPVTLLFEVPTVSELALRLQEMSDATTPVAADIRPASGPVLPCQSSADALNALRKRPLQFSLYFFSADGSTSSSAKYSLLFDSTKFADQNDFTAVWVPERHFSPFGGLYPNPSVLGAALAVKTQRIQIRAGSVVLPLQDPLRVAEEWAVVDNLSGGRVGIAFASGWQPNDFVLAPDSYAARRQIMKERIDTIRRLWRGETIRRHNGVGQQVDVRVFPRALQQELPIWLAAHSDETFITAGEIGANIVTNLWKTSFPDLARQIRLYREAWQNHSPSRKRGKVTLMVHTYLAAAENDIHEKVCRSYRDYLFAFLQLREGQAQGSHADFHLLPDDREDLVSSATQQLLATHGLVGTPETCLTTLAEMQNLDVDEVACLIDFGIEHESVMNSLRHLADLRHRANGTADCPAAPLAEP